MNENYEWVQDNQPKPPKTPFNWKRLRNVVMAVVLAIPILMLYNGQRGKDRRVHVVMKWLFYLYYPLHLGLLGWIRFAAGL